MFRIHACEQCGGPGNVVLGKDTNRGQRSSGPSPQKTARAGGGSQGPHVILELWQCGGKGAPRRKDQRSAALEDDRAAAGSAAPPFAATSRAIRESVRKSSRSMFSILIRKPKRCSSANSSSTNWNESRIPVSRRSVSEDGTSTWKLSTNSAPRRSMMAFTSVRLASCLVPCLRRADPATHPADVRRRRRSHLRLHRARFAAVEALP